MLGVTNVIVGIFSSLILKQFHPCSKDFISVLSVFQGCFSLLQFSSHKI